MYVLLPPLVFLTIRDSEHFTMKCTCLKDNTWWIEILDDQVYR